MQPKTFSLTPYISRLQACARYLDKTRMRVLVQVHGQVNLDKPNNKLVSTS